MNALGGTVSGGAVMWVGVFGSLLTVHRSLKKGGDKNKTCLACNRRLWVK